MLFRFETTLLQSSTIVEKRGQISHFMAPVKIRGRVGEMSESVFRVTLTTEPLQHAETCS